jgi:hypothetical protein
VTIALPKTTWVPGESPRPDDAWLNAIDPDLLVHVGAVLFEKQFGFEAHEAWEQAWKSSKAEGRFDDERMLRALIKLAAAMVKVRQKNPVGVRDHAHGAAAALDDVTAKAVLGFDVAAVVAMARRVEAGAAALDLTLFGKLIRA